MALFPFVMAAFVFAHGLLWRHHNVSYLGVFSNSLEVNFMLSDPWIPRGYSARLYMQCFRRSSSSSDCGHRRFVKKIYFTIKTYSTRHHSASNIPTSICILTPPTSMTDIPFVPLLIDGERRPASTGATFSVPSPHTGLITSTSAAASSEDCRAAIEAAQRAFPAWEATPRATRRNILLRAAATLRSEEWQKKIASSMRAEVAMPQAFIGFNFFIGPQILENIACLANDLKGETYPSQVPGGQVFVQRRAHGVVCVP